MPKNLTILYLLWALFFTLFVHLSSTKRHWACKHELSYLQISQQVVAINDDLPLEYSCRNVKQVAGAQCKTRFTAVKLRRGSRGMITQNR